ncbi:MAG: XRE family transcriptional regulator [Deltaproteobacteria bacterium]|nr:MAG: XRE family transcriptional regulator [Deltaproteobacteria bacterium]
MNTLLKQLKTARQEKGLKQSEFGKKLGLPQSHISRIERGKTDPRLSTVADMARIADHELMLVPRRLVPVIRFMTEGGNDQEPMWKPDE